MNPEIIIKGSRGENRKKRSFFSQPLRVICLSFALVILVGTILLCLPISSKSREVTPLVNSLFTATSATCVTGLITYDTFTHWSRFGQIVIILLIQVGGLGLGVGVQLLRHLDPGNLGQHGGADDHGRQRGDQEG